MRPRRTAVLLLLPWLGGCHSWQRREVPAAAASPAVALEHPVRVTRADRSTVVLERARVEGDSVVGSGGWPARRVAVALRDIHALEEERADTRRTLILVGGVALISVAFFWAAVTALSGLSY